MSNDLIIAARMAESLYGSMIMPFFSSTEMHLIAICKKAFSAIFPCCVKRPTLRALFARRTFGIKNYSKMVLQIAIRHFILIRKKEIIRLPSVLFIIQGD